MSRYYQLIVFLTVYCIKNNCDQTESSPGYQLKCKNDICSESIGLVVATQNYRPDERHKLKYNIEDKIEIFGTTIDGQYYFAKLNDRQGLVSKKLVREVKQYLKEDDLILTNLDDSWKPIIKLEPSDGDSFIQSSTSSSVEEEITSNSADDVSISISENMEIKPDIQSVSDSPIDKLQTSFQPGNNQEEPTSSLQDFQHDQMKTVDSSIAVKSEEITKSQPQQANTDIVPTMPSIASDPPRLTTEVDGTTFPVDEYEEDEISLQSSTPTPSMDMRPPPFVGYSGQNNGIGPSDIPSRSNTPNQQSFGALNLSPSVEMSKVNGNSEASVVMDQPKINSQDKNPTPIVPDDPINKEDQPQESNVFNEIVNEKSPELSPSIVYESIPSSLPLHPINTDDLAGRESNLSPQSESSSDVKGTGFVDNVNNQPSETTTATPATESLSPAAVDGITESQNGHTTNSIDSDQLIDKLDVNNIESNEINLQPQVQNQDQSSSTPSPLILVIDSGRDQYGFPSNQEGSKIQESHKDESLTDEVHHHGTVETEIQNPKINEVSSTPSPILQQQQQQQLPASSKPSIYNQQQPLPNQDEPVHQYNQPNYHHQTVHQQQQQPQRPPIIGTNDDYKHNNQPDYPSDEMTHQMAAEVEKQSYLSPSSSLYLPPQQESVTTDLPLSSLPPSPDSDSDSSLHLSSSVNNQNFDSNLALPMQSSSLLSNSASPSDQQSTFNGPSESLTDSFTQTTFTETPISTNYPDAMRSQITLLTTLLPEPVIDYLHHVNFSPSIFVILLMITITWLVMFITSKILSSHKEKVSLEDQLCRNHGENFNLKTERDYLFDELAAEKEKNSRNYSRNI